MATLSDILKQQFQVARSPGGQLSLERPQTISQLASRLGMPVQPTDPMSAAAIGANFDQQKMAGSPQQVQAAITQALEPSEQLTTAERRTPGSSAQPIFGARKTLANIGELSNIPERVQQFIEIQKQKILQASLVTQQAVEQVPGGVQGATQINWVSLKSDLELFRANPADLQVLSRINQQLGRDSNSLLSPDEIKSMYQSAVEAIASGAQGVIDRDLTVGDLVQLPDFGVSLSDLAQSLNKPQDVVSSMSLKDLQESIESLEGRAEVQAVDVGAQAPELGQAEREEFREIGREISESGERVTEAELSRLEQAIEAGETVVFGGERRLLSDVLSDDFISKQVQDYLNAPEGDPSRKKLEESEPGLVDFIRKNVAALSQLSSQMESSSAELGKIQKENQALKQFGNVSLSDALMKSIVPGWGEISSSAIDISAIPLLNAAKRLPKEKAEQLAAAANAIQAGFPDLLDDLLGLSESEIEQLANKPEVLGTLSRVNAAVAQIDALSTSNPDSILDAFFGEDVSAEQLERQLQDDEIRAKMGMETSGLASLVDIDRDQKVDSPESILERMKAEQRGGGLKEALRGDLREFVSKKFEKLADIPEAREFILSPLAKLSGTEDTRLRDTAIGMTWEQLVKLENISGSLTATARDVILKAFGYKRGDNTRIILAEIYRTAPNLDPSKYDMKRKAKIVVAGKRVDTTTGRSLIGKDPDIVIPNEKSAFATTLRRMEKAIGKAKEHIDMLKKIAESPEVDRGSIERSISGMEMAVKRLEGKNKSLKVLSGESDTPPVWVDPSWGGILKKDGVVVNTRTSKQPALHEMVLFAALNGMNTISKLLGG